MAAGDMSRERAEREIAAVNQAINEGFPPTNLPGNNVRRSAIVVAAERLRENRKSFEERVGNPRRKFVSTWKRLYDLEPDWGIGAQFAVEHSHVSPAFTFGPAVELISRPDNTFLFGAAGDLHAASKYTRWDVREDLYRMFIDEGAQCNFDTGNWIDGESRFNTYDLEVHGFDAQCRLLARQHPKGLQTYAVWGDDHEGWYVQREGMDVGMYCESIMRQADLPWTNLGFMEAHVVLRNANTGKTASMAVVHPGGGSAYALSYSVQKIVESLEGGEKPAVALYGHYHKLWSGIIRNVWCVQTGCAQDQTPFMRKKRLEAQVGGVLVKLRQDPETGAIVSMQPEMVRYFNRGFHAGTNRWSRHGPVTQVPRRANQR